MAGRLRLAVADHDLPDGRPQTVGADQSRAAIALAAFGLHRHAARFSSTATTFCEASSLIRLVVRQASSKRRWEIGAMDQRIGMMDFFAERSAERNEDVPLPVVESIMTRLLEM